MAEFELIASLERFLSGDRPGVPLGVGDDAAVVDIDGVGVAIAVDALVEDVHFDLAISSPADVGWKALAANVSDLAAIGTRTTAAVVAVAVPDGQDDQVRGLYAGMAELADGAGIALVGGDTTSGPVLSIAVTVIGPAHPAGPMRRDGARPGDIVVVVGRLGEAAAGLALARAGADALLQAHPELLRAHRRPVALVDEGVALAEVATSCIDVSDGLGQDLGHIARRSGVRIDLAELPVSEGVGAAAQLLDVDPLELVVGGGDDLALAATVPPDRLGELDTAWRRVGEVSAGEGVWSAGREISASGWQHGRRSS